MRNDSNKISRLLYFFAVIACVIASGRVNAAEDWVAEEIFKQINELRVDNNKLRKDVEQLKTQLAKLKSGKSNPRIVSQVSMDDDPVMGKDVAKVAIIEFTDYQCSFCRRHKEQTLPKLKENYIDTGKVQYVLRDFPLNFHKQAQSAAIAANCAGEQGAYWSMHEKLFDRSTQASKNSYLQLAENMKLDMDKYASCLDDPAQVTEVNKDLKYGEQIGVNGTPAFFIGKIKNGQVVNAQFISGARPYSSFSKVIDSMLN